MEFNYIPDQEIDLSEKGNDLLGTNVYAESLYDIIKAKYNKPLQEPLTIGLFGGWGSGKSSIIKTLKAKLNKDNIIIMKYDVWKYSEDAFRRSFLLELSETYNLSKSSNLELFYKDKHEDIAGETKLIKNWWIIGLLIAIIVFFGLNIINIKSLISNGEIDYIRLVSSFIIAPFTFFLSKTFYTFKISITKPKIFSPEQFERIFRDAVDTIINPIAFSSEWWKQVANSKRKIKKVIIVFDNLDRCEEAEAKKLLLTIKNFLDYKNCLYIIPIAAEDFKCRLKFSNEDGNEFLRKFFTITISLKNLDNEDLFDFTDKLINKYNLPFKENNEVKRIISQEFSKNPRRIIQFLNNLNYELFLADKREESKSIVTSSITSNIEFLTKILIIKDQFPEIYAAILYDPGNLKVIEDRIRNHESGEKMISITSLDKELTLTNEARLFFQRTSTIKSNSINSFIKISDNTKGLPKDLILYINSQEWSAIKEMLDKEELSFDKYISILEQQLDLHVIKRKLGAIEFFNIVFSTFNEEKFTTHLPKYYPRFERFLHHKNFDVNISEYASQKLIGFAKNLDKIEKKHIKEAIVTAINRGTKDSILKLLNSYLEVFNDEKSLSEIKEKFSEIIIKEEKLLLNYRDLLEDSEKIKSLFTSKLISHLVNSISQSLNDELDILRINIITLLNVDNELEKNQEVSFINKIIPYLQTNVLNEISIWLDSLLSFVDKFNNVQEDKLFKLIGEKYSFSQSQINPAVLSEDEVNFFTIFIGFIKKMYLQYKRDQYFLWIIRIYESNGDQKVHSLINDIFKKFAETQLQNEEIFDSVFKKFNSISLENGKALFAETLNLIVIQSKALNESFLDQLIKQYFSLYFSNQIKNDIFIEWIKTISVNAKVREITVKYLLTISDLEQLKKVIGTLDKINITEYYLDIPEKIIKSSNNIHEYEININFVDNSLRNSKISIRKVIPELIDKYIDSNRNQFIVLLSICIKFKDLIGKDNINHIIDKFERILPADDNHEMQMTAINFLDGLLKNDLYENRRSWLIPMLEKRNFENEKDSQLLNKVISNLK